MKTLSNPKAPDIASCPAVNVFVVRPGDSSAMSTGRRPIGSASISPFVKLCPVATVVRVDGASAVTVMVSVRAASDIFAFTSIVPPTVRMTFSRRAGRKLSRSNVTE